MEKGANSAKQGPEIKRPRLDNHYDALQSQPFQMIYLLLGNDIISVPRKVLEENSGYFRLRLSYLADGDSMIEMPIVDGVLFREVVRYMYGEEINIHTTVVDALYELASFLEVDGLCRTIVERLGKNLHISYAVAQKIAVRFGIPTLYRLCREFVFENFEALAATKSFHFMDFPTLLTALETVCDKVHNRRTVYDAIVGWTHQDLGNRIDHFEQIFACIPLHKLPLAFLEDDMLRESLVRDSERCTELINSAVDSAHMRSEGYAVMTQNCSVIDAFHPMTGRFYEMKNPSPEKVSTSCTVVTLDDYVYVLEYTGTVRRFKLSGVTVVWEEMPSMNNCHLHHNFKIPVLVVRGCLYVVGGGLFTRYDHGEMMVPTNSRWTLLPELSIRAEYCCFAEANDEIYAMGGWNGDVVLSSVIKFNIHSRKWLSVPPMNVQRHSATAVSRRRQIYVMGGFEGDLCFRSDVHTIECFDLRTNQWSISTSFLHGPWFSPQACLVDEKIFVAAMMSLSNLQGAPVPNVKNGRLWLLDESKNIWKSMGTFSTADIGHFSLIRLGPRRDFDFKIVVGSKEIPANRQFLAEKSAYFKAMFSHDTLENQTGIVKINGLRKTCTKWCIDHIHGAQLDMKKCMRDTEGMIHAATTFLLDDVVDSISVHLMEELCVSNFEYTKRLSYTYDCGSLDDVCDGFAVENFELISTATMFLKMEKEYVKFLIESQFGKQCRRSTAHVEDPPCLSTRPVGPGPICFEAIIRWTTHDLPDRLRHLVELFSCLDLIKTPVKYVENQMQSSELVKGSPECQILIRRSLAKRKELHEVLLASDTRGALMVYNCQRKEWNKLKAYIDCIQYWNRIHASVIDDGLYVLTDMGLVNRLWFNVSNATWDEILNYNGDIDMEEIVDMVPCGRDLYVFGTNGITRYNIDQGHWTELEHALNKIDYTVIPAEDHIYVVGGSGWSDRSEVEAVRYAISTDTWTDIAQLTMPRANAAGVHFNGHIYVMGGIHADVPTDSVEVYHPDENIWCSFRKMQFGRANFKAVVMNETIFVVGGDENSPQTMEYLGTDREWKIMVTSKPRLNNLSVVVAKLKYEILVSESDPTSPGDTGRDGRTNAHRPISPIRPMPHQRRCRLLIY